jgi:DNA helicase-2/ATP-dependent DNA helicase PcrA
MKHHELDYINLLNEPQREAVLHTEGPVMIIAGAGSGKTRVLTCRIAHLLRNGVDAFNILSLTFTNKAAREMRERIEKVVGTEARNLWMGTFHSIFTRILRTESEKIGYPRNFTIYDTDDAKSLIKSIVAELKLDEKIYKPAIVLNRISNAKNNLINARGYFEDSALTEADTASGRPKIAEIYLAYQDRCFKAGAMDFDDLLMKTYELLNRHTDVLNKYQHQFRYIMVDEFQDTNHCQYMIVRKLAAAFQNICVVGDDAQSIYAFRGATIKNILDFHKDYPDLQVFKLEQNYRSTQTIVEASSSIISKNRDQLKKQVFTENIPGSKISVFKAINDNEEGRMVASSIFEEKMREHRANADFAILYRTNAQSRALEEALRKLNIPYRIYGGLSFYQRKEIKDLLAYFRLTINPQDEEALKRVINYPARGIGKTSIDKLIVLSAHHNTSMWTILENAESFTADLKAAVRSLVEFRTMIQSFMVMSKQANAFDVAMHIAKSSALLKTLYEDKTVEGIARYENIQELLNGIKEFTVDEPVEGEVNFLPRTLDNYMQDIALLTDADKDDEADQDKVKLMTIHASKGLEFPYVYIVGLEENLFPSQLSVNSRQELEEERRLFYVAMTRAMHKLTLAYATSRFKFGTLNPAEPSRFLFEIDPQFLHMERLFAGSQQSSRDLSGFEDRMGSGSKRTSLSGLNVKKLPGNFTSLPKAFSKPAAQTGGDSDFVPDDTTHLKEGMQVLHQRFGKGEVLKLEGNADNRKATINFMGLGHKQLILKFAKLKILS